MTVAREPTVRTWSATADAEGAANYTRYFTGTLLPELRKLAGFEGACLLRRDVGGNATVELTAHTVWESAAAIRAFAGDDITVAIVEPEARAMLLDFDRTATHRRVAASAGLNASPEPRGLRARVTPAGHRPGRAHGSPVSPVPARNHRM
jgi:hypothetical protein